MAFLYQVLRVVVLGVIAAALNDVPITWSPRVALLPCTVAGSGRIRRPPPLLGEDRSEIKYFTWKKGGEEVNPKRIHQDGTLEVRMSDVSGDGVYQCMVRHHRYVLGYPINLKFAYINKTFSEQPQNVTARLGQPLTIPCQINSGPNAIISWTRDGANLATNNRYHLLEYELLITDVRREDAGLYRCTATNSIVNKTRVSHEGLVVVKDSIAAEPSMLTIHDAKNITVDRDSRVVLLCPVTGWPRPKLIWELTPLGGRTSELETTDEVLVLPKLEYDQEGLYVCTVEGRSDLVKIFNVAIKEPVEITLPPLSKEAMRASTVRFNCMAAGRPTPNITWYKDGSLLPLAGRINLRTSVDRTRIELVISGLTSDDAGVYQCFASNGFTTSSEWARLNVTGAEAAAPAEVTCTPVGVSSVELRWQSEDNNTLAYTVVHTPIDNGGESLTGQPKKDTIDIVKMKEPLTPYIFQVRAFTPLSIGMKNIASDMSESVICQGQGVPIKLRKLDDDKVQVSWKQFSDQHSGVVQWILQYKSAVMHDETLDEVHNITLAGSVTQYNLTAPKSTPLLVRLLGSRTFRWLPQNLTLVPWLSTNSAGQQGQDADDGIVTLIPRELQVTDVKDQSFTLTWQYEDASRYTFMVCWKKANSNEMCQESYRTNTTIEGLQPDSTYEVRVQARLPGKLLGSSFSPPFHVTTQSEGTYRFKDLTYTFVNETTIRISWSGPPANYTVNYSAQLKLPVEMWAAVSTTANTVLIKDIDPTEQTFVMVTVYNPQDHTKDHSNIIHIPAPIKELDPKDLEYQYTSSGVLVWWSGPGVRTVRFTQNITQPLDSWNSINVTEPRIELNNVDKNLPVYVMVTAAAGGRKQHVLTIPLRPPGTNYYSQDYIGLGIGCGLVLLCVLMAGAFFFWRRAKANRTLERSRRTQASAGTEEEGSEMKVRRERVANGGVGTGAGAGAGAGEPLLNGHVHITENPASKTPNGRIKKGRRYEPPAYDAFDVSRNDYDTTLETVLEDTTYSLLDTSRRPDCNMSRSCHNLSQPITDNSFNKLPDDNMNSELTRSTEFQLDNSKIQPTLQPNG